MIKQAFCKGAKENMPKLYSNVLDLIGNTPIVKINGTYNGYKPKNLYVKLEYFNPGGSVKDRVAYNMIKTALDNLEIRPDSVIIEPTSGNTGVGLALCASILGLEFIAVMPENMSDERKKLISAYGAKIVLTPKNLGMQGSVDKAAQIAQKLREEGRNVFETKQFENPNNPLSHIKTADESYVKNEKGRVCGGNEFLSVLDGMTGKEIARADWPERNNRYGNLIRQNRNQMGMAFLDGKTPFILAARGTYKLMVVDAWMLKGNKLERVWRWDGDEENPIVRSMGAHSMVTADVDGDNRDEILLGSCMLDDNGTLLWSSGLGHSDKAYLCKLHPEMEGMQVFMVSEPKKEDGRGVSVVDAATGKLIWSIGHTTYHVGDGMVADFDPSHPGLECFASEDRKGGSTDKYLLTAKGEKITTGNNRVPGCRNWVWWDADLLRETFKGDDNRWGAGSSSNGRKQLIWKWQGDVLTTGIEGDILMIADMEGDWREEVITALPGEIRIYHTNIPATDRRTTLMQNPLYRSYVAHRSMGYPQAPVPSYYLGE